MYLYCQDGKVFSDFELKTLLQRIRVSNNVYINPFSTPATSKKAPSASITGTFAIQASTIPSKFHFLSANALLFEHKRTHPLYKREWCLWKPPHVCSCCISSSNINDIIWTEWVYGVYMGGCWIYPPIIVSNLNLNVRIRRDRTTVTIVWRLTKIAQVHARLSHSTFVTISGLLFDSCCHCWNKGKFDLCTLAQSAFLKFNGFVLQLWAELGSKDVKSW